MAVSGTCCSACCFCHVKGLSKAELCARLCVSLSFFRENKEIIARLLLLCLVVHFVRFLLIFPSTRHTVDIERVLMLVSVCYVHKYLINFPPSLFQRPPPSSLSIPYKQFFQGTTCSKCLLYPGTEREGSPGGDDLVQCEKKGRKRKGWLSLLSLSPLSSLSLMDGGCFIV